MSKLDKLTICLNMIVKNESHIIEKTLTNLCKKIKFDYWIICDTGSTDNTIEIINNFFLNINIPGKIYNDKWINFAHNRTLALNYAYEKTDLLLIFDADDEIVGTINLPEIVNYDGYYLIFKEDNISYNRVLLINNKIKWAYKSIIHEYNYCINPTNGTNILQGDYYIKSGRFGSRNKNPNKYFDDAIILEKEYYNEKNNENELCGRYSFYCANSYRDAKNIEKSIIWYKINLTENGWLQEKYISCLELFNAYNIIDQKEIGYYYLTKAFAFDKERVECIYHLIVHYCCENLDEIAFAYYNLIQNYYENIYQNIDIYSQDKLFININIYNFYLPYYMIIVACKINNIKLGLIMYEIIFTKKPEIFLEWWLNNLIYNFQFFINYIPSDSKNRIINLANNYLKFLFTNNVPLYNFDILKIYNIYGIDIDYIFLEDINNNHINELCINSKNILFYTGYSIEPWNYTYSISNALGGSEKAVAYLSKYFSNNFNIYICGGVKKEIINNISYIPFDELNNLINNTYFHTIIISRYISFYNIYPQTKFYQSYIWAHDTMLLSYGSELNVDEILIKYNNKIKGCICLTEYHKELYKNIYPILQNKISIINNGINCDQFPINIKKQTNKFIYTSCTERGLEILLNLWPSIINNIPNATLVISSYNDFPNNDFDIKLKQIIDKYPSITHLGKLNTSKLYKEMASSDFWLYTCIYPETSCITALEILMSQVIPIYYDIGALIYTLNNNGIKTVYGNEIKDILSLSHNDKNNLRKNGKKYANTCSWKSKAKEWETLLDI